MLQVGHVEEPRLPRKLERLIALHPFIVKEVGPLPAVYLLQRGAGSAPLFRYRSLTLNRAHDQAEQDSSCQMATHRKGGADHCSFSVSRSPDTVSNLSGKFRTRGGLPATPSRPHP